ncbi:MAG: hypothetical protein EOP54_01745 [Sphingobacteriales bacterium]|nr:MAG: hypothetical protein EOP54_01745 [Sphingobacteriales bacterium]
MQSTAPILIIGQGIAGTLLSFELFTAGVPFQVIDQVDTNCASWASGAVLNPYSGRTIKGISRRNQMYLVARNKYQQLEGLIGSKILHHTPLIVFEAEDPDTTVPVPEAILKAFKQQNDIQLFDEVALVDNALLLKEWSKVLEQNQCITNGLFDLEQLSYQDGPLKYQGKQYSKLIFCTGVTAHDSPLFSSLRFTQNRGDVLLIRSEQLNHNFIYQKDKLRLLPRPDHTFWCGSNYLWAYEDMIPNRGWAEQTIAQLNSWLQTPFEVKDHFCAKRPTTAGQIPFIGWHPLFPDIGICNGLGTKGFSAGPLWIENFVQESILNKQAAMFQYVLDKWCR